MAVRYQAFRLFRFRVRSRLRTFLMQANVQRTPYEVCVSWVSQYLQHHHFILGDFIQNIQTHLINIFWKVINVFMNYKFTRWGLEYWKISDMDCSFFPFMVNCHISLGGITGAPGANNYLCILPNNTISSVSFTVLWFWYAALLPVSLMNAIYRILYLIFPSIARLIKSACPFRQDFKPPVSDIQWEMLFPSTYQWTNMDQQIFSSYN